MDDDIQDEQPRHHQAGEQDGGKKRPHRNIGRGRQHDHHHRGRDRGSQRAAAADRARNQRFAVIVAQHDRDGQQPDDGFGGPDHAAGRGKDRAQQDGADRQAAGQPAGPHMDRLEQLFGNAGAFQQRAHQDEQRHRGQHIVRCKVLNLGDELVHGGIAEPYETKDQRHPQKRKGDRNPDKYGDKKRRKHP